MRGHVNQLYAASNDISPAADTEVRLKRADMLALISGSPFV